MKKGKAKRKTSARLSPAKGKVAKHDDFLTEMVSPRPHGRDGQEERISRRSNSKGSRNAGGLPLRTSVAELGLI